MRTGRDRTKSDGRKNGCDGEREVKRYAFEWGFFFFKIQMIGTSSRRAVMPFIIGETVFVETNVDTLVENGLAAAAFDVCGYGGQRPIRGCVRLIFFGFFFFFCFPRFPRTYGRRRAAVHRSLWEDGVDRRHACTAAAVVVAVVSRARYPNLTR